MRARRLTARGITRFQELLQGLVSGSAGELSREMLTADALSEDLGADVSVEPHGLGETRLQAAGYLHERLVRSGLSEPDRDAGLWAWLSVLYFDSVCPRDPHGHYRPGAPARYVPLLSDTRRTYRHRLLGPYLIFSAHVEDPYRALCLLCQPLTRPGSLVERLASRPRLVACPAAVGVATLLFCDGHSIRRGAPAHVDRLSDVLMQLDRTYDIYGMTAEALLKLLPREFDAFRKGRARRRR